MKIEASISMGLVGCHREEVIEIDEEDLEGLDENGRSDVADERAREWLWNGSGLDFGWTEVEEPTP